MSIVKFWVNAFIPSSLHGAFTVPKGSYQGRQVFKAPPLPFHYNSCFETDEREFSNKLPASSRVQVIGEFNTASKTLLPTSGLFGGETFEIDCTSCDSKCKSGVTPRGAGLKLAAGATDSVADVGIECFANDPCVTGSPDITIRGTFSLNIAKRTFRYSINTTFFPAIEMYMSVDNGAAVTLFTQKPSYHSVFILMVPGIKSHAGSGSF